MTTAARPTFDPAKGKAENELTYMTSAKDLPSHTKLKTRKPGQGNAKEYSIEDLKRELKEAEDRHFETKRIGQSSGSILADDKAQSLLKNEKTKYIEMAQQIDAESDESSNDEDETSCSNSGEENESNGDGSDAQSDDSSDEDSEDETTMLLRELEKIKRERAEEKAREGKEELERRLQEEANGGSAASLLGNNPLLAKRDFSVKRRWDDDVVFRNQARGDDGKTKKRFINDMLRSDFHRKFMRKYIQ
ncbi:complexed with cef1p [Coemansia spiralis]|uniref:Complexed with cef1p n=2 Tax=Coemansia TaxID=4863 RepID=A0A9W8G9Y2_9FUNG|nr:complexed with cef1p [Coemansia umbellata]KAJ2623514.1 complexed with cef1p [Coemansia sp. RSA 1358]KAJ2678915.1 complexed with cef1p [Coemansia spiralis]